jgi:hypothetical protein
MTIPGCFFCKKSLTQFKTCIASHLQSSSMQVIKKFFTRNRGSWFVGLWVKKLTRITLQYFIFLLPERCDIHNKIWFDILILDIKINGTWSPFGLSNFVFFHFNFCKSCIKCGFPYQLVGTAMIRMTIVQCSSHNHVHYSWKFAFALSPNLVLYIMFMFRSCSTK